MSEVIQSQRPWFFNLKSDGDSAVVRILHTTIDTIESNVSHRIVIEGKHKRVRCLKENCPLCESDNVADKRIYIHLFDYTDNKEKVWDRTDKILPQLQSLQQDWNPLHSAVVKITRRGNDFPKYDVVPVNPMQYAPVDEKLVDKPLAKFYSMGRNAEEIKTFLSTGKFPVRKEFIPKEEYLKQKKAQETPNTTVAVQPTENTTVSNPFESTLSTPNTNSIDNDNPFMDSFITPRKV